MLYNYLLIRPFPSKDVATLISNYKKKSCICLELDSKVQAKEDIAKTK